jgi:tRNA threonylcarbamoyladenosine biosynthesis protein TsaB
VLILAIDTALEACSAAIVKDGLALAVRSEPMARGHQEHLAPLIAELSARSGVRIGGIDRIAVTIGPGSFTGLRAGLAFAKGLGFALGRPVIGLGTLEALVDEREPGLTAAVIDARRGQVYLEAFRDGVTVLGPTLLGLKESVDKLINIDAAGPSTLVGPGAELISRHFPKARVASRAHPDPAHLARLAASRPAPSGGLSPLYLRPPDARPPS